MTAGEEYTFTVKTMNGDAACETSLEVAVSTYGAGSYTADNLPTVEAIKRDGSISFEWSDIDADLKSVQVTYGDAAQTAVDVVEGVITMSDITAGDDLTFSYIANFKPVNGTEMVTVEVESSPIVSDIVLNGDVYEIYTAAGLKEFADIVNGTHATIAKNAAADGKLMADVDLSEVCGESNPWAPIGQNPTSNSAPQYTGDFDGGEFTVSGLYTYAEDVSYQALFGYAGGAISNITIDSPTCTGYQMTAAVVGRMNGAASVDNCHVIGTSLFTGLGNYTSAIVGNNAGTISNCTVSGNLTISSTAGYPAAIAGTNTGTVQNCSVTGVISITNTSKDVGGVVGYNNGGRVIDCSVNANGVISSTGGNCGGIAAYSTGLVLDCHVSPADGGDLSITGKTEDTKAASCGGVVGGTAGGAIIGCTNSAYVYSSARNAAGVVSYAKNVTVIGCSNRGAIESKSQTAGGIAGRANEGGGSAQILLGCYNFGSMSASNNETAGIFGCCNAIGHFYGCYSTFDSQKSGLVGYSSQAATTFGGNYFYKTENTLTAVNGVDPEGTTGLTTLTDFNANVSGLNEGITEGLAHVYTNVSNSGKTNIAEFLSEKYGLTITKCEYVVNGDYPEIDFAYTLE